MLVLLFTVFLSSFVAYSLNLYWKRVNYWQSRRVPSPKQHWLWGNIEGYRRNQSFNEIFHNYYRQYHDNSLPILGVYSCITPFALITDPQLAKRMLIEDFGYFRNRGLYHNPRDSSNNIFVLDYEKWKVFRSKLSPIFTSGKLKIMLPKFLKATKDLVAVMEEDIIGGDSILDIKELMLRYTVEIIGSCAFGLQTNSLAYPEGDFSRLAQEQTVIGESNGTIAKFLMISFPKLANLLRLEYIPEYMNDFYLNLVKTILDIRESNNMQFNDIFDTLKEMRNPDNSLLSLKEITAQTIFFFQAGYETSAYSLTFALYELARREDLQAKVREEIFNVLRKHKNILSFNCLGEMKYLQQILMGK